MRATTRAIGVSLNVFAAVGAAIVILNGYRPWHIWLILVSVLGVLWGFWTIASHELARR
jgi:hypothetical protein